MLSKGYPVGHGKMIHQWLGTNELDEWADLLKNPTRESSSLVLKCASLQMWEEEVLHGKTRLSGKPREERKTP